MAISDGLKVQVYPQAGDTAVKNIVDNSDFTVTGAAPTLGTDGGVPVWLMNANTLLKKAIASKVLDTNSDGNGITIVLRFKRVTAGSVTYMDFAGVTTAGGASGSGVRIVGFDSNLYRGRASGAANTNTAVTTTGVANGNILTLVYRFSTLAVSSGAPNMDSGAIWQNRVGRVGTAPDAIAYGNANTITIGEAMLNAQTGSAWTLFDFAYFDIEKPEADCAAIADDYRAVMPAPGAGTPVTFTGTVPDQIAVVDTPFSLPLASYFSGSLTPFSYALQSGSLPDGITLDSATGEISGTPTGIDTTTIVVRASDSGSNAADTNAFTLEVNLAAQVPQGTVTLGTPTGITSSSAAIPYSYSASDQTGFEYRINGGSAQTVTTTPLALTGLTAATAYTVEIRAVNAVGAGTWSSPANFTTSPAALPPQGTFAISTITAGQTTASVPYTYSASDQTSIQYRLNGGSAVTATASPQALSGLTAGTAYTIEFRAVNANGNGNWSAPANFTTQAAPSTDGVITLPELKNNTATPLTSLSGFNITLLTTTNPKSVVYNSGSISTNSSAALIFSNAAINAGTEYVYLIERAGTAFAAGKVTAT